MNPDLFSLLQKAKESLAAAELLRDENYFDFAASRSYYAMFYIAEALLASIGQAYSSHAAVQAAFGREFAKTGKLDAKFHRWLLDSMDLRNLGDYGPGSRVTLEQATELCAWTREFIQAAEDYLNQKGI
jgi:uncharacterized protein (UPF0332 family)